MKRFLAVAFLPPDEATSIFATLCLLIM